MQFGAFTHMILHFRRSFIGYGWKFIDYEVISIYVLDKLNIISSGHELACFQEAYILRLYFYVNFVD